ncbi:hypothetical protein DIPPA_34385 [Diplonema papillatum]|nr:hypothetical protein DIPPA_34385 [Diplonema papillatum]
MTPNCQLSAAAGLCDETLVVCRQTLRLGPGGRSEPKAAAPAAGRRIPQLTDEVRQCLESFTFADQEPAAEEQRPGWVPALGTSAQQLRLLGTVPERLNLHCGEHPELEGLYSLMPDLFNGMPAWASGQARLYSSKNGLWSVVDSEAGQAADLGWVTSVTCHHGIGPHVLCNWQVFDSSRWVNTYPSPFTVAVVAKPKAKGRDNDAGYQLLRMARIIARREQRAGHQQHAAAEEQSKQPEKAAAACAKKEHPTAAAATEFLSRENSSVGYYSDKVSSSSRLSHAALSEGRQRTTRKRHSSMSPLSTATASVSFCTTPLAID